MKYTVYLYHAVRIRMEDIEADSQDEAVHIAVKECDVKDSLAHCAFEDDEAPFLGAKVDEEDDKDYEMTRYFQGPGVRNYLAYSDEELSGVLGRGD